ncbi:uncharacterized protein RSE6_01846 [Rhynchosporium secalis]|uniref:Uncharacterized protein n=1 Tax=Rhynchosporium secalis TaxID=38038 RepID=A0A1E1LYV2_RHYSE|nr:uncharacterized protein RSE6_01846 [Rhynchosporium secalis]
MQELQPQGGGPNYRSSTQIMIDITKASNQLIPISSSTGRLHVELWYIIRDNLAQLNGQDFEDDIAAKSLQTGLSLCDRSDERHQHGLPHSKNQVHIDPRFGLTTSKFPAIRVLIMENYPSCHKHTNEVINASWDFSRLKSLRLNLIVIKGFLDTVTITDLRFLKTRVIKECQFPNIDYDGDEPDFDEVDLTAWFTDITTTLPHLEEFIFFDSYHCEINMPVEIFVKKITRFPKLRKLNLALYKKNIGTSDVLEEKHEDDLQAESDASTSDNDVGVSDPTEAETAKNLEDPMYDSAEAIKKNLHLGKVGVPIEVITLEVTIDCEHNRCKLVVCVDNIYEYQYPKRISRGSGRFLSMSVFRSCAKRNLV